MDITLSAWFVILLALCAANLPFVNERLFGLIALRRSEKAVWMRLAELTVLYFLVGFVARLLEGRLGSVASQGWEFHAVTVCLFLVLAYPGYVYRYLRKRRA